MSASLEHIKEAISGLDEDAQRTILKVVGAMQEEIEILEFRLKRLEKIKRTTAIFLDESVAELEQKRAAEEQINSALESSLSELKRTQAQLVEQEKLASLGALTAGIAHEIKNPLNFVNNFAEIGGELAQELVEALGSGNTEEARSILSEIESNSAQIAKHGKRADSIVRSMMQHARGGTSDREAVVLNDFIEEYANLSWHGMRARDHSFQAELIRNYDPDVGEIAVMPQELGRVILNLLNNSFDAVRDVEQARVTIGTLKLNDHIEIRVSDNGPGIPEDIRDKIFEPFFTTKATGEGTGLGLSLSHDIVTKGHGGSMTVQSADNGGALFLVRLPM